jgi:hypothetical protein
VRGKRHGEGYKDDDRRTYSKEIMYELNLFIHSKRLLCEIRQEPITSQYHLHHQDRTGQDNKFDVT